MSEKPVKILFKYLDQKDNQLHRGTITMKELYNTNSNQVYVTDSCGSEEVISRRNFHVIDDDQPEKSRAIVCDIDGVLNFIPNHEILGHKISDHIMLPDGIESCQWTELNKSAGALHNLTNFRLLAHFYDQGNDIVFLTARGDTQRFHTEKWLREGFDKIRRSDITYTLFMRGWSCNDLPAPAMKAQMFQSCIIPNYDVEYYIEDCPSNCAAVSKVCPDIKIMQIHS